jgi:hypothetical protein
MNRIGMTLNELALSTFLVAEPRRGVSVGALFADARKRDGEECGVARARATVPKRSDNAKLYAVTLMFIGKEFAH